MSLKNDQKPSLLPTNFGDVLSWSVGTLEPGGPPAVKIEWPDTPQGRADCKAFVGHIFEDLPHAD